MYFTKIEKLREIAKQLTTLNINSIAVQGIATLEYSSEIRLKVNQNTEVQLEKFGSILSICIIDLPTNTHACLYFCKECEPELSITFFERENGDIKLKKSLYFCDEEGAPMYSTINDNHEWIAFMTERMTAFL